MILSPYAPHMAEELWHLMGHQESVSFVQFPGYNEEYLREDSVTYAVSFNGKLRFTVDLPMDMPRDEIEQSVLSMEKAQKWLEGKPPKKVIIVLGKIINIVV